MNLAEFNYLIRQKVLKQLILPHPPTYVTNKKCQKNDNWYFTSQKFITLKKKRQNTVFDKFLKNNDLKKKDKQSIQQFNSLQMLLNIHQNDNYLLFIMKQRSNFIQSKLLHIIDQHQQISGNIKRSYLKSKCTTCQQFQRNDYDFVLIQRKKFLQMYQFTESQSDINQKIIKEQQVSSSKLGDKIDMILRTILYTSKQQIDINRKQVLQKQLPKSTFNPYINNFGSQFKYYITRIQSLREKHHYMVANTNRINYRQKVHSTLLVRDIGDNNTFGQIDQVYDQKIKKNKVNSNQLWQMISSVVWNRQYVLFDVEKVDNIKKSQNNQQKFYENQRKFNNTNKTTKVTNNHMKQKITQKCQILQNHLETYFSELFYQTLKRKNLSNKVYQNKQNNKHVKQIKVNVKQFRLWYMNNYMRNNHVYTICLSDLKVQFCYQQNGQQTKRWLGEFWTRFDLKKNYQFSSNTKILDQQNIQLQNNFIKPPRQSVSIIKSKIKSRTLQSSYKLMKNVHEKQIKQTLDKGQSTKQFMQQNFERTSQQKCECCKDFFQPRNNRQEQYTVAKRKIVARHVNKLRQNVNELIMNQVKNIKQQLSTFLVKDPKVTNTRSNQQIQKQNQLVRQLQKKQLKLNTLKRLLQNSSKKQLSILHSSVKKKRQYDNLLKRQYDEVTVCEQCYQVFLEKIIKQQKYKKRSTIDKRKSNLKQSRQNKINSFFVQQNVDKLKQIKNCSRKKILSAKNHCDTMIPSSMSHKQRHLGDCDLSFIRKQIVPHNKKINKRILNILDSDIQFSTNNILQYQSKTLQNDQKERQSTKDNTVIFQLFPSRVIHLRQSLNIDVSVEKNPKKKTRMQRFQEQMERDQFW